MGILLREPAIVPDTFCSGLAEPEDLGDGTYRFVYFANQARYDCVMATEHIIVAKLVLSFSSVLSARMQMSRRFGCYCGKDRKMNLAH